MQQRISVQVFRAKRRQSRLQLRQRANRRVAERPAIRVPRDPGCSASWSFTVAERAETVTISKSVSGSGIGQVSQGTIFFSGPNGTIGFYGIDFESGLVINDTLPRAKPSSRVVHDFS
jgi:hypothetical protein